MCADPQHGFNDRVRIGSFPHVLWQFCQKEQGKLHKVFGFGLPVVSPRTDRDLRNPRADHNGAVPGVVSVQVEHEERYYHQGKDRIIGNQQLFTELHLFHMRITPFKI